MKLKKIIKNIRIILLIIFLVLAVIAIHPNPWAEGLAIRSVTKNSSASQAGIISPSSSTQPMSKERILLINSQPIKELEDYYDFVSTLEINRTFTIKTDKDIYKLTAQPEYKITRLNETINKTITEEVYNQTLNKTVNQTRTIQVPKVKKEIIGVEDPGLSLYEAPKTNIRQGLDLSGGTRVVLIPKEETSAQDLEFVIDNIKQRLNVFGISDVTVRKATDLQGQDFIIVEIAGATKEEVSDLLSNQGKFEAKISNQTVFRGGTDITYVCRSSECSGIDTQTGCGQISGGDWTCRFRFSIAISPEAAQTQAQATKDLEIIVENEESYLSEKLRLYLDDELVDELSIGADLRGNPVTDISISGSGTGQTREAAMNDALKNMKRLQTILITGSLPVKLEIVKTDNISPVLGEEFIRNAMLMGILAILAVAATVFIRYRKLIVSIPMIITMTSEAVIILGIASLIGWNIDLAAIAGIIIAIGTGVDHQIVITDETLTGERSQYAGWKEKLKNAFFIIIAAYFTTVVAMLPLWFAGAGLLKGFALTTILGVSVGVLITRPAFSAIIEIFTQSQQ